MRGLNSSPPASMYFRAMARWACQLAAAASFPAACAGPLAGRAAAGALGRRGMRAPGGAFLAYAVADLLGVAFLAGHRWPGETGRYHLPAVRGGIDDWRVGVVDDAVNAGTAVVACLEELRGRGAVPVAVATLVSLGEASTTVQARMRVPFYPASTVPSRAWPAERCPLCAEGAPCTDPLSGDVVTPLPGRGPVGAGTSGFRGGNADVSAETPCASFNLTSSQQWYGATTRRP